jgi:TIR domain
VRYARHRLGKNQDQRGDMSKRPAKKSYEYDVALSFAGEDRAHPEKLCRLLVPHGVKVFYDQSARATLWGKNLYQHLETIYKDRAQYCVVFVSKHYVKKNWTKHELQHAQARSFADDREYILPLRIDDAVLPGVAATIGYLDLRTITVEQVAALLLEKLGKDVVNLDEDIERAKWAGDFVEYNGAKVASFWPKMIEAAQHKPTSLVIKPFDRVRYSKEKWWKHEKQRPPPTCHDCAVLPGQYHVPGCDMEECPACGGQQIGCGCRFEAISEERLRRWEEDEDFDG